MIYFIDLDASAFNRPMDTYNIMFVPTKKIIEVKNAGTIFCNTDAKLTGTFGSVKRGNWELKNGIVYDIDNFKNKFDINLNMQKIH